MFRRHASNYWTTGGECGTSHGCSGGRKHTPVVSEAQRGLMGAELARRREGEKGRMSGITTAELESHLEEAGGKHLPKKAK